MLGALSFKVVPMIETVFQWFVKHPIDYLQIFLVVGGLMMVHGILRTSRDPYTKLNVYDMLLDPSGRMSLTKTAQFGAFAISTWGFVHLVVYNNLTEWYYTSYMVAWAGTQLLTFYISKGRGGTVGEQPPYGQPPPNPPPSS